MNLRYLPPGTIDTLQRRFPSAYNFMLKATLQGECHSLERDAAIFEKHDTAHPDLPGIRRRIAELRDPKLDLF